MLARRDTFTNDREYRLLTAVACGSDVEPMPGWGASLFCQEETLGRMPIDRAFRRLADTEPRLLAVEKRARESSRETTSDSAAHEISQALRKLVGSGAEQNGPLIRSRLASRIAHHYLWIVLGETAFGRPDISFFEASRK